MIHGVHETVRPIPLVQADAVERPARAKGTGRRVAVPMFAADLLPSARPGLIAALTFVVAIAALHLR